jgi:hypothetical protein
MPETEEQRRRFFRRRMLKGARIFQQRQFDIFLHSPRHFRGRSAAGDWQHAGIPDEFTLTMEDGSASFRCKVRRRTMTTLGVEFVSA